MSNFFFYEPWNLFDWNHKAESKLYKGFLQYWCPPDYLLGAIFQRRGSHSAQENVDITFVLMQFGWGVAIISDTTRQWGQVGYLVIGFFQFLSWVLSYPVSVCAWLCAKLWASACVCAITQLFQEDCGHLSESKVEAMVWIARESSQMNAEFIRHLQKKIWTWDRCKSSLWHADRQTDKQSDAHTNEHTMGRTRLHRINSHLIIHCPMSSEVSKVSERASEWAQRSARAKQVVQSKRMSERCERTDDRVAQYSNLYSWLFWPRVWC